MRRYPMLATLAAVSVATLHTLDAQSRSRDWPRWRGAAFDGVAAAPDTTFKAPFRLRTRWKRTLGAGYSGVVVADGHALTMFSDGTSDVLVSLSSESGREEWRLAIAPTYPGRDGSTGGPVSTPAISDGAVFAIGPRGEVVAARVDDGRPLWRRHLVEDFGSEIPHWGFTTSPLVVGDVVVILAGGREGHALIALDRRTGTTIWHNGTDTVSYQSPVIATIGGRQQIVGAGDRFLFGLDPADGRQLWRHEHGGTGFYGRIINPVVVADGLLMTYKPDESIFVRSDGSKAPTTVWTTRELKLSYATPVVHDGLVFGYSGTFLAAVDAATGRPKWRSRPPGDGFPIMVNGHLVVLTKEGQLTVAEANAHGFTPKTSLDLFSRLVWTPPSFAEGRIYARDSYEEIAAVDIVDAGTETETALAPARGVLPNSQFGRWVAKVERAADQASLVRTFLEEQKSFPIIEDGRIAHIVFSGDGRDLSLVSDGLGTGVSWPLNRVGTTDLYYISMDLERDARISYQFTRGPSDTFPDPRNPAKATSQNFAGDVSLLLMPDADRALPAARPLKGRLSDLEFDSGSASAAHLRWGGKRKVRVYLPPGYDTGADRYPTVYVMYGEEMLAGGHFAATLEGATASGMRPAIVVFVENTSGFEYARTFRDAHARMMAERLVPWIDGQFRTRTAAADRVIVGADEAGFAAVEIALRYPTLFGNIVAQSLFPLSQGDEELIAAIARVPRSEQRFYIDWGKYDPRRASDQLDVPGFSNRVRDQLAARGFSVTGRGWNDGSTLPFWSARAARAVAELLRK